MIHVDYCLFTYTDTDNESNSTPILNSWGGNQNESEKFSCSANYNVDLDLFICDNSRRLLDRGLDAKLLGNPSQRWEITHVF